MIAGGHNSEFLLLSSQGMHYVPHKDIIKVPTGAQIYWASMVIQILNQSLCPLWEGAGIDTVIH